MSRWRGAAGLALFLSSGLRERTRGLRDRFLARVHADLERIPEFVCLETADRFRRTGWERPWEKIDTVRFEVALVGNEELYGLPGRRHLQSRPLGDFVAKGSISTGQLALLARHVFLTSAAQYAYRGESEVGGCAAYEYDYDVPASKSSYHLRSGISGSFLD